MNTVLISTQNPNAPRIRIKPVHPLLRPYKTTEHYVIETDSEGKDTATTRATIETVTLLHRILLKSGYVESSPMSLQDESAKSNKKLGHTDEPQKLLYKFRIVRMPREQQPASAREEGFPIRLLTSEECWPATEDDAETIRQMLEFDIPVTHRCPVELRSRSCFNTHAWVEAGWNVISHPSTVF